MTKIDDGRIGSLDKKGMIEKYPTHYATGGFWNRSANATPSTCYFGKEHNYFFVLPIKVPTISEALWDEFFGLINEERPVPVAPAKKKVEEAVETTVIAGATKDSPAIIKPKSKKSRAHEEALEESDADDSHYAFDNHVDGETE